MSDVYRYRDWYVPPRMLVSIRLYVEQKCPVGDFLTAVLEGDLFEALFRADDENMANIPAFAAYLYNEVPSMCYGNKEKVRAWLDSGFKEREEAHAKADC